MWWGGSYLFLLITWSPLPVRMCSQILPLGCLLYFSNQSLCYHVRLSLNDIPLKQHVCLLLTYYSIWVDVVNAFQFLRLSSYTDIYIWLPAIWLLSSITVICAPIPTYWLQDVVRLLFLAGVRGWTAGRRTCPNGHRKLSPAAGRRTCPKGHRKPSSAAGLSSKCGWYQYSRSWFLPLVSVKKKPGSIRKSAQITSNW